MRRKFAFGAAVKRPSILIKVYGNYFHWKGYYEK